MNGRTKILLAGVGGQGVVYLTNIIVEAAMLSGIPVSVSEIHGLSQRGGVVTSGIGLGENCTGFTGNANVDLLIGLEPLETQRCIAMLHKKSSIIFGNYRMMPYSVNAQMAEYPDIGKLYLYLKSQCSEVVFIEKFPEGVQAVLFNIFLLGCAVKMKKFPIHESKIEEAIHKVVGDYYRENTLKIYKLGVQNQIKEPIL